MCALRLSEKGYRVRVLEQGRRFKGADFAAFRPTVARIHHRSRLRPNPRSLADDCLGEPAKPVPHHHRPS
ncbi:hypothetical protein GL305_16505 [Nocardia seriolae]|nr:hypothetical protein [Nocardia seriolae]MTJ74751.1 hypothetical protein [Nocardia seriolae]MTJ87535.1 hypothetical protein [Nocardia seriolae]MTK31526.1 hypothetical protein [Nocardia seriolae]MTK42345.1 hypothetical protein [Nocardia seriolae]